MHAIPRHGLITVRMCPSLPPSGCCFRFPPLPGSLKPLARGSPSRSLTSLTPSQNKPDTGTGGIRSPGGVPIAVPRNGAVPSRRRMHSKGSTGPGLPSRNHALSFGSSHWCRITPSFSEPVVSIMEVAFYTSSRQNGRLRSGSSHVVVFFFTRQVRCIHPVIEGQAVILCTLLNFFLSQNIQMDRVF